jgi:hypothetical protein
MGRHYDTMAPWRSYLDARCPAAHGAWMTNSGTGSLTGGMEGIKLFRDFGAFMWLTMMNIVRRKMLTAMMEKLSRNQVHQITALETP